MPFNTNQRASAVLLEAVAGTYNDPTFGTDDLVVQDLSLSFDRNTVTLNLDNPDGLAGRDVCVGQSVGVSWTTPFYGLGVDGGTGVINLPTWLATVLQSHGTLEIGSADPTSAQWTPTTAGATFIDDTDVVTDLEDSFSMKTVCAGAGDKSLTTAGNEKFVVRLKGVTLSSVAITMSTKNTVSLAFTATGSIESMGDELIDISAYAYDGWDRQPTQGNLTTATIDAQEACTNEYTINIDWAPEAIDCDTTESGEVSRSATQNSITGTIRPLYTAQAVFDWEPFYDPCACGDTHTLGMNPAGVFPGCRNTNEGYGLLVEVPEFTVNASSQIDKGGSALRTQIDFTAEAGNPPIIFRVF